MNKELSYQSEEQKKHIRARIDYIINTNIEDIAPSYFDDYTGDNVSKLRMYLAEIQRLLKEMKADEA